MFEFKGEIDIIQGQHLLVHKIPNTEYQISNNWHKILNTTKYQTKHTNAEYQQMQMILLPGSIEVEAVGDDCLARW